VLGASAAHATRGSIKPEPAAFQITVVPHGQRDVKVSWTLRARASGARVILYAGSSVGFGTPLAEARVAPGLNSFQFVDRSGHAGQWLYWLVVVDDKGRGSVLGTLVCVSPSMNDSPRPTSGPNADPAWVEWPKEEPIVHWLTSREQTAAIRDLDLQAPPEPPPEGSSMA
jgi:hypothetical protein